MFDFVNYTYSGVLAILSALFGLSYPLVIGCIEKIDDRFGSSKLSERFKNERLFKFFKFFLGINLLMAVLSPFFMDGCIYARCIIGLQCIFVVVLVFLTFKLFSKILTYYNVTELQKEILDDYNKAVENKNKEEEKEYFNQWLDISSELLKSVDNNLVQSVYEVLQGYVLRLQKENKGNNLEFDNYYYEGVSRINEFLSKGDVRPISVNNTNSILTSLIDYDSVISDTTYRYLWRNIRIQMYYNKDEWIMSYWKRASGNVLLFSNRYSYEDQNKKKQKQYEYFKEFHIMLCAMLMQQKKYKLLGSMLSFTQTEPPSYPLVPSSLREIINDFNRINRKSFNSPFYYESKYPMPDMHGITEGKIIGAVNCYLALLLYRIYVIRWNYEHELIFNIGALPNTLSELRILKDDLKNLKVCLERIKNDKELLSVIGVNDVDEEIKNKINNDRKILPPDQLVSHMQDEIEDKMRDIREKEQLSEDKVIKEENKLTKDIVRAMEPYADLLNQNFGQGKSYDLNSSIIMPFPNTAFLDNPDVDHIGCADSMSSYMLQNFYHFFSTSFYQEHSYAYYSLSSDDLFKGVDRLKLTDEHYIIAFGIYLDFYIDKIKGLSKEDNHRYKYNNTKILVLNCSSEYFSQLLYVMRYEDRPYLTFDEPSKENKEKFSLKEFNKNYRLWLSIKKTNDLVSLEESIKEKLGDKVNEYSLFVANWLPKIFFKSEKYPMVSIKVKYRLTNEGNYDSVDKVKSFCEFEKTK